MPTVNNAYRKIVRNQVIPITNKKTGETEFRSKGGGGGGIEWASCANKIKGAGKSGYGAGGTLEQISGNNTDKYYEENKPGGGGGMGENIQRPSGWSAIAWSPIGIPIFAATLTAPAAGLGGVATVTALTETGVVVTTQGTSAVMGAPYLPALAGTAALAATAYAGEQYEWGIDKNGQPYARAYKNNGWTMPQGGGASLYSGFTRPQAPRFQPFTQPCGRGAGADAGGGEIAANPTRELSFEEVQYLSKLKGTPLWQWEYNRLNAGGTIQEMNTNADAPTSAKGR